MPLSAAEWLAVWDQAQAATPALRPCVYLAPLLGASVAEGRCAAEALPIGSRDNRLLGLYCELFGAHLSAVASCPACAAPLEFDLDTRAMQLGDAASEPIVLDHGGARWRLRLPDSRDLAALYDCADDAEARRRLGERCIEALEGDAAPSVAEASEELFDAAARALGEADPQALCELALTCPACGHPWSEPLDIAPLFDTVMSRWANSLLDEVHEIALGYGWHEAQILSMPAVRRARYIDRLRS